MLSCEKWFGVKSTYQVHEIDSDLFVKFTKYTLNDGIFGFVGKKRNDVNKMRLILKEDSSATPFKVFFKKLISLCYFS